MNGPTGTPALLTVLSFYDAAGPEPQRGASAKIVGIGIDIVVDDEARDAGGMPGRLI